MKPQRYSSFHSFSPLALLSGLYIFCLPFFAGRTLSDSLSWYQGMYVNYFQFRITLHFVIACLVIFAFVKSLKEDRRKKILYGFSTVLGLVIYNFCITLTQNSIVFSFLSSFRLFEILTLYMSLFISISTLFGIFHKLEEQEKREEVLVFSIISASIIQLGFSVYQVINSRPLFSDFFYILGQPKVFDSNTFVGINILSRAYGTTPHPNILAGIMVLFAILLLLTTFPLLKRIGLAVVPISVLALTLSRSGVLALFLGVIGIIMVLLAFRVQSLKGFIQNGVQNRFFPALIIISGNVLGTITMLLASHIENIPYFISTRIILLKAYFEIIFQKGLLGILFGQGFLTSIPLLVKNSSQLSLSLIFEGTFLIEPPHNGLLLLINETGLIGTIILVLFGSWAFNEFFLLKTKNLSQQEIKKETPRLLAMRVSLIFAATIILLLDHYLIY